MGLTLSDARSSYYYILYDSELLKETEQKLREKVFELEKLNKRDQSEFGETLDIFKKNIHQESDICIYNFNICKIIYPISGH